LSDEGEHPGLAELCVHLTGCHAIELAAAHAVLSPQMP
jgi:hypothetical protein